MPTASQLRRPPRGRRTARLAATLALAGLAALPAAAQATAPGANGAIAFVRDGDIWAIEADGSDPRRLTTDPAAESHPAWSADGTAIAFTRAGEGGTDVWAMTLGQPAVRVTSADGDELAPALSPDGTRIAYAAVVEQPWGPPVRTLRVIDRDGTDDRLLSGFGTDPEWSPDGTRIAFGSGSDNGRLYVLEPDGDTNRRQFPGTGDHTGQEGIDGQPSWAPDGTAVAYTRLRYASEEPGDLGVGVSVATLSGTRRAISPTREAQPDADPSWSPDGREVAVVRASGARSSIWVLGADGAGERELTLAAAGGTAPAWQPLPSLIPPTPVTPGGTAVPAPRAAPAGAPAPVTLPSGSVGPVLDAPPAVLRGVLRPSLRRIGAPRLARVGARLAVVARFDRLPDGARVVLQRRRAGRFGPVAAARARGGVVRIAYRPRTTGRLLLRLAFRDAAGPRVSRTFAIRVRPR